MKGQPVEKIKGGPLKGSSKGEAGAVSSAPSSVCWVSEGVSKTSPHVCRDAEGMSRLRALDSYCVSLPAHRLAGKGVGRNVYRNRSNIAVG